MFHLASVLSVWHSGEWKHWSVHHTAIREPQTPSCFWSGSGGLCGLTKLIPKLLAWTKCSTICFKWSIQLLQYVAMLGTSCGWTDAVVGCSTSIAWRCSEVTKCSTGGHCHLEFVYILKPKAHSLHHIAISVRHQLESGIPVVLNPHTFSNDMSEDFLGRISRLSRRVGFRKMDLRVPQRYFLEIVSLLRQRRANKMPRWQKDKRQKRW